MICLERREEDHKDARCRMIGLASQKKKKLLTAFSWCAFAMFLLDTTILLLLSQVTVHAFVVVHHHHTTTCLQDRPSLFCNKNRHGTTRKNHNNKQHSFLSPLSTPSCPLWPTTTTERPCSSLERVKRTRDGTEVIAKRVWSKCRTGLSHCFQQTTTRRRLESLQLSRHLGGLRLRSRVRVLASTLLMLCGGILLGYPKIAWAGGGGFGGSSATSALAAPLSRRALVSLGSLWCSLFLALALLHAAEIAITTLYPWKVREIAEEEEKSGKSRGVFTTLNEDITRVLTTILVTSTACSIYMTTLFTQLFSSLFGTMGHAERYGAIVLTALTLFFVELLPKSVGVVNAERVARLMIPPITIVSRVVSPLGITLSWLAKFTLRLLGVKEQKKGSGNSVSDSQLRLIVTGALDSGTIDHGEQEMIQGVLNLQNQRVKEVMRPRVDITAVPRDMSVVKVLGSIRESGYSRIPVYDGEIDNIVGIVLAKSVLDFFVHGVIVDDGNHNQYTAKAKYATLSASSEADGRHKNINNSISNGNDGSNGKSSSSLYASERVPIRAKDGHEEGYVRTLTATELASRMEMSIADAGLIESCYFVPDSANGWSVLQEMRKRRVHMAVVVDEFGGTEGLVSMEDIVEEVVGGACW